MEDIATSTIVSVSNNISFWQNLPAAWFVILGVIISGFFATLSAIISGVFTIYSDKRNNKNSKELKELENKNSKELKELEDKNSKEIQASENTHKEKLQSLKDDGDKSRRLLDVRIEEFSNFHNNYSGICFGGDSKLRLSKIRDLRETIFKIQLLVPSLKNEIANLDEELVKYEALYIKIVNNTDTGSVKEKENKVKEISGKIKNLVVPIIDSLPGEL